MALTNDINSIVSWFKSLNIDPIYIPYILGFLASILQVFAWFTHTVLPDSYSMTQII